MDSSMCTAADRQYSIFLKTGWILSLLIASAMVAFGQPAQTSWRFYSPGNTGIQGDYNEAIWIGEDGDPYIAGYQPSFEEGGFAKFIQTENRWENYSTVDYLLLGDPADVGSSRVSDIEADANGILWMATWRGAWKFDPVVGPASLANFDASNTVHPGGRSRDVAIAPDGTVWFAVLAVSWGTGGLVRYEPLNDTWTWWGYGHIRNNWPSLTASCDAVAVQPKATGGYTVWIHGDNTGRIISFDSGTQLFTELPAASRGGDIAMFPKTDAVDDEGNLWALRIPPGGGFNYSLDYRRVDGTWVVPPQVSNDIWAFRAYGNRQALLVDGSSRTWRFNGTSWENLGIWRTGGFSYAVNTDDAGNVWVSGIGGAAKRDNVTGLWQRYRVTNTSQFGYWNDDLTIDPDDGFVYVGGNAGPGIGGMSRFDGKRWYCFNNETYGLGAPWPFSNDNCQAMAYRPSNGHVALTPYWGYGIHEWTGSGFIPLQPTGGAERLCEDSNGRLWSLGEYYSLSYYNGTTWTQVGIDGWGRNVMRDPDQPGTVWATANFQVIRTDGITEFSRWVEDFRELNPQSDYITTVAPAPGGIAWVGTNQGLIRLDANRGTYVFFSPSNSQIPGRDIWPMAVTPDGRVWFSNFGDGSTANPGLCWFDGTEFGIFTVEPGGLPHAQIADMEVNILPDSYELWVSCLSQAIAVLTVPLAQAPDVSASLTLTPPSGNGIFTLTYSATNNMASSQAVDMWVVMTRPNGAMKEVLNRSATIAPGGTFTRNKTLDLSTRPNGDYTYTLNVGDYPSTVWSSDSKIYGKNSTGLDRGDGTSWLSDGLPVETELEGNYPNPFNPETTLRFSLSAPQEVTLTIYNTLGERVATLVDAFLPAGYHEVVWDGRSDVGGQVSSGVYFQRLVAGGTVQTKKMLVAK